MAAADIDVELRDEFVKHAVNFDSDNNGYLKKAELQAAADAWNAEAEETVEEVAEEEVAAEEAVEEAATEEEVATEEASSEDAEAEEKACPTCNAMCAADATSCSVCFYTF